MKVWELLKQFVRDMETLNGVKFGNESWNLVKQLERDIQAYIYEEYEKPNMPVETPDSEAS